MATNNNVPTALTQNDEPLLVRQYENKHQLAARIGVSVRTIDNLLKRGLPYIRLTRKLIRFPRVAVDQWLTERQVRRS
jgi:excisionase family DNA binding protein